MPFREPVDPLQLGIPDYHDIIKHPMDLSTIKNKLDTGQYPDPWSFVDDVWLMFDNAWLYNKKSSRVYKCCTKVYFIILNIHLSPVESYLDYCPQFLICHFCTDFCLESLEFARFILSLLFDFTACRDIRTGN